MPNNINTIEQRFVEFLHCSALQVQIIGIYTYIHYAIGFDMLNEEGFHCETKSLGNSIRLGRQLLNGEI